MTDDDDELYEALAGRDLTDEQIEAMSPEQKFDEYCEWQGLTGWGPTLRRIMKAAQE